jgi:hypothetical protein
MAIECSLIVAIVTLMLVLFLQTQSSEVNMVATVGGPSWTISYPTDVNTIVPGAGLTAVDNSAGATSIWQSVLANSVFGHSVVNTIGHPAGTASPTWYAGIIGVLPSDSMGWILVAVNLLTLGAVFVGLQPADRKRSWKVNVSDLTRRISKRVGAPMLRPVLSTSSAHKFATFSSY